MSKASVVTERVRAVRALMREQRLDGLIVRGTDRYLNEYVPAAESTRVWLTGFTGSAGDAFLTLERGWVAVDGRYTLQADDELAGTPFVPEHLPLGKSIGSAIADLMRAAAERGVRRVGYEPDRTSVKAFEALERAASAAGVELVPTLPSLVELARGPVKERALPLRPVDEASVGRSVAEKVALARGALEAAGVDAYAVVPLDALAYLTNLRGDDFPYQATFRGLGILTRERVLLAVDPERLAPEAREARADAIEWTGPKDWAEGLAGRVGFDPADTTCAVRDAIAAAGAEAVPMPSPLAPMKAKKTPAELEAMRRAFRAADAVVDGVVAWVHERLDAGERVSELDLANEVERRFLASGATGLSFRVIAAAGEHGAIIHYSTPDPERFLEPDELVLLDTGAYYAEGYATDLTRTFLAGSPARIPSARPEQRRMFTLVLKAAIAGMSARLPEGATGVQLDALVRAPLWAEGLDFRHGTGHGVGINVHEAPPRISTRGSDALEVGHVFSIEPGLYLTGQGGVRIENLCTVVPAEGAPGYLDVVPLTFAALDERLIDSDRLTARERRWLEGYRTERARGAASP